MSFQTVLISSKSCDMNVTLIPSNSTLDFVVRGHSAIDHVKSQEYTRYLKSRRALHLSKQIREPENS